ncbi:hypothetical protein Acor_15810 [Acrocarpospora corrugata]|uniref:NB-ARC domain-containing protein n=1 Tax=Acrocarpospora corrugata TaxID=35763 RepID=A0A5M3VYR8_9ACTN|nr:hypothetical protein [Acrocarpospora corrugata]GER99517.1 hypothetical protein Acor_15810 [Acrocarpospora corrugata]
MGIHGDNQGIVATGDHTTNTQITIPVEALRPVGEVAAPPGTINVPGAGHMFVGRAEDLAALDAALRPDSGEGSGRVAVAAVHGLGGVGKSALAARYATTRATSITANTANAVGAGVDGSPGAGGVNPVWWIVADSAGAVQTGLADLAVALQPELKQALPLEALPQRALAWLAAHQDWLLVADNVTDPADVAVLLDRTLAGRGTMVVTSRLGEGWHRLGARVLRLDVLAESEAIELLTRIAAPDRPVGDGAAELVRELGCLPLAVEQAAAYLHQARISPRAYLERLAEQPAVMYERSARGADAERSIARIWRLTLDQLATTPLAGQLLRVLAWYGAEEIPRTLLEDLAPDIEVEQALGELAAYNMITLTETGITVHRLVQAVARTPDPADPHRRSEDIEAARRRATVLLAEALPGHFEDPNRVAASAEPAEPHHRPDRPRAPRHRHRNHRPPPQPDRPLLEQSRRHRRRGRDAPARLRRI